MTTSTETPKPTAPAAPAERAGAKVLARVRRDGLPLIGHYPVARQLQILLAHWAALQNMMTILKAMNTLFHPP